MRSEVTIIDPAISKDVKVQKDGTIYLSRDLAGHRVNVVAERTEPTEADQLAEEILKAAEAGEAADRERLIRDAVDELGGTVDQ